jgi:uncharacterized protein
MPAVRRSAGLVWRSAPSAALAVGLLAGTASAASATPAMWEVSDADSKVFLFGSIHILPTGVVWRAPAFEAALKAAPEVYFETDVGPLGMFALTLKMVGLTVQSFGTSWVDGLTPEQRAKLLAAITPMGLDLQTVDRYPPWVTEGQIELGGASKANAGSGANDTQNGVDWTLEWELPKERKAFFETPGQQFDILAGNPQDVQIRQLFETIDATASPGDTLTALTAAWTKGDVDALTLQTTGGSPDDSAALDRLLFNRNRNWVPTIERLLDENRQDLIVVGAAHLAGPDSVLDLLAKAGFTVTRVQ